MSVAAIVLCGVGLVVAGFATYRYWRRLRAEDAVPPFVERPERVAYLNDGGDIIALATAIAHLRVAGAVDADADGRLVATGPTPDDASPLTRAVHRAVTPGARFDALAQDRDVVEALGRLHQELLAAGWLVPVEGRRRLRLAGWCFFAAAAALGLWAIAIWGAIPGYVVGGLTMLSLGASFVLLLPPRRTRAGQEALDAAIGATTRMDPEDPDVPMLVAVFGPAVLDLPDGVVPRYRTSTNPTGVDGGWSYGDAPSGGGG